MPGGTGAPTGPKPTAKTSPRSTHLAAGGGILAVAVLAAVMLRQATKAEPTPEAVAGVARTKPEGVAASARPGIPVTAPTPSDVWQMTAAEIEAADRRVDAAVAAVAAAAGRQASADRRTMEGLCDALGRAAVGEPSYGRGVYRDVSNVQQVALAPFQPGGGTADVDLLRSLRQMFVRTESQAAIDRMIALADRHNAQVERRAREVAAAEAARPARRATAAWSAVASDADRSLRQAATFLARSDGGAAASVASREDLRALLDGIESGAAADRAAAGDLRRALDGHRQRVGTTARSAAAFLAVVALAGQASSSIDAADARLGAVEGRDPSAAVEYHRRFVGRLPATLDDMAALNAFGDAVAAARSRDAAAWAVPTIAAGYARWQAAAYDALMRGSLGSRVRDAVGAHAAATKSMAADLRWHRAATALSADESRALGEYVGGRALTPVPDGAALNAVLSDALDERGETTIDRPGDLMPFSPVMQARRVAAPEAGGRAYHRSIFREVGARGTLEAVAGLRTLAETGAAAKPAFWGPAARRAYVGFQAAQWRASCSTHLTGDVVAAAKAYFAQNYWPDAGKAFGPGGPPSKPSEVQIRGVLAMLDGGFIKSDEDVGPAERRGGDELALDFGGGLRLAGTYDRKAGDVLTGPGDQPFWEDLLWLRERGAAAGGPALSADFNPYAATRSSALPGPMSAAQRRYHLSLLKRAAGGKSLADVAAIKALVAGETKRSPDMWLREEWRAPYAALQAYQWARFYESNLLKDESLVKAYAWPQEAAAWARASRPWRPHAAGMLTLLRDGLVDRQAFQGTLSTIYTHVRSDRDRDGWAVPSTAEFWQAVQAGR